MYKMESRASGAGFSKAVMISFLGIKGLGFRL